MVVDGDGGGFAAGAGGAEEGEGDLAALKPHCLAGPHVLWRGDVVNKKNQDNLTISIRKFNSYVFNDKRTENLIIPVGDGLTICRKL